MAGTSSPADFQRATLKLPVHTNAIQANITNVNSLEIVPFLDLLLTRIYLPRRPADRKSRCTPSHWAVHTLGLHRLREGSLVGWSGLTIRTAARGKTTYINDRIFLLEHSTSKRTLAPIVQSIWICAMLNEELDQIRMTVVSRKHELSQLATSTKVNGMFRFIPVYHLSHLSYWRVGRLARPARRRKRHPCGQHRTCGQRMLRLRAASCRCFHRNHPSRTSDCAGETVLWSGLRPATKKVYGARPLTDDELVGQDSCWDCIARGTVLGTLVCILVRSAFCTGTLVSCWIALCAGVTSQRKSR